MYPGFTSFRSHIERYLQIRSPDATVLLIEHGPGWIQQGHAREVYDLLQQLKQQTPATPDLHLVEAQALLELAQLDEAIDRLEQTQAWFDRLHRPDGELHCLLLLARIHHRQEDLDTARLFTEEAAVFLHTHPLLPADLQADTYLCLARLSPNVGQLALGLHLAQQSLYFYAETRNQSGQFDATLLIALIARQIGHFQTATTYLNRAKRWHSRWNLPINSWLSLISAEAHSAWYQGDLSQARAILESAFPLVDQNPASKFRVYLRLTLANVLRGQGEFDRAEALYKETETLLSELDFPLFQIWVDANLGWLYILREDYAQARRCLFYALETTDRGQAVSLNMCLAVLYNLTERFTEASSLLRDGLHYYQTSGDELSVFALRFHLAYHYLQTDHPERAEEEIALALAWAELWNVDYFPLWWHPQMVAAVCAHAFAAGLYPHMAERLLVKRLKEDAIPALHRLESHASPTVRRRVEDVLALLEVELLSYLTKRGDNAVRHALNDLLNRGLLLHQTLPRLVHRLSTTRHSHKANPVLLATFGLYIHGSSRRQIAQRLDRSESTIRNYIGLIYERFGIDASDEARSERFLALRKAAVAAGYVRGGDADV
jgi:tetratricopeptide (TPR) repeat protein